MLSLRSIASTLVKIYPAAPANADAWLAEEIRARSLRPGRPGRVQARSFCGSFFCVGLWGALKVLCLPLKACMCTTEL